mmetsp:Transcript_18461/g.29448  ORF Transcript_18461/g.29448 Transcript_18461/m.29448 type:complete len:82 (-) Transcript_18461:24-269(-)
MSPGGNAQCNAAPAARIRAHWTDTKTHSCGPHNSDRFCMIAHMAMAAQFFLLMEANMPQARSLARYARGTLHDTPGENMKK